jgi:exodeoxyribonuclease VII small subunit
MLLMKIKNNSDNFKSKSIKEAKDEINEILNKLEKNDTDLDDSIEEYQKLIQLNNHIKDLFKKRVQKISEMTKIKKKL